MRHTTHLILASVGLSATLLGQANSNRPTTEAPQTNRPLVVTSDIVLGADVVEAGTANSEKPKKTDTVSDMVVDSRNGKFHAVILESGSIITPDRVIWIPESKCFELRGDDARSATEAAARRGNDSGDAEGGAADSGKVQPGQVLASHLIGAPLVGLERKDKNLERAELGSVGGLFVDVNSGHVVFLTTSVGGVLGIGAESKVVPWDATEISFDDDADKCKVTTTLTAKRLEKAPNYGKGADQLHNPEYRCQLYSYFGCDRPKYDCEEIHGSSKQLVTLARVMDAEVRHGGEDCAIDDLVVDCSNGKTAYAMLDNGSVIPTSGLTWDEKTEKFAVSKNAKAIDDFDDAKFVTATALSGLAVHAADGECGAVEDIYVDCKTNQIEYVTVSVGTTLGMGGEVLALPWSAVKVEQDDDTPHILLPKTKAELENAPKLDGEAGSDMHNPAFRKRVSGYCSSTD